MKNVIMLDATLAILGFTFVLKFFVLMAGHGDPGLLSAVPGEFQYLAGLDF